MTVLRISPTAAITMFYHIVSIDAPGCSLYCKDGQVTCKSVEGARRIPLEDVGAVIITSFSASIHFKFLLEAAKTPRFLNQGIDRLDCGTDLLDMGACGTLSAFGLRMVWGPGVCQTRAGFHIPGGDQ